MSSQKARVILHWFSARYGENSPLPCHCVRKKVYFSDAQTWSSVLSIRWVMDSLEIRVEISSFQSAMSSQASLWEH
jgi:hypothetical protein